MQTAKTILIIDDEPNFLTQLKAYLAMLDFNILTALNAGEALGLLKANADIVLVVADQRMPLTTGAELLSQVQILYPEKIRVLITGYSDISAVIDAVNKGAIYRYISKKALPEEIAATLRQCLDKYHADLEIKRLSSANATLLKKLAAVESLSAAGLFGKQISLKLEEIIQGLSGFLFKNAGQNENQLVHSLKFMEMCVEKIRSLANLDLESQEPDSPLPILIEKEIGILRLAAGKAGLKLDLSSYEDPLIPHIPFPQGLIQKLLREIFENAIVFGPMGARIINITTELVKSEKTPKLKISVQNSFHTSMEKDTGKYFAPFYTTLGQLDQPAAREFGSAGYNLSKFGHFGLGLPIARWIALTLGGEIIIYNRGKNWVTEIVLPLKNQP